MPIRKHGAATGRVTGIDEPGTSRVAARREEPGTTWDAKDDKDLAAENLAADGPQDDD
jgi:hypothetical protein